MEGLKMAKEISVKEAVKVIKEWGVDCDNYVAHTYRQYMYGGDPCDNSMECANYFIECLKLVCYLGIKSFNHPIRG